VTVAELEREHPWLLNIAIGLLVGVITWLLGNTLWVIVAVPVIWAPLRVAMLRAFAK
jgi:Na+/H+ antiporter NhaD/arsenite permease-like protein